MLVADKKNCYLIATTNSRLVDDLQFNFELIEVFITPWLCTHNSSLDITRTEKIYAYKFTKLIF